MDIPNCKYFQPPPASASHAESPMEPNLKLYGTSKGSPVVAAFSDSLSNLNLRETSESVRSFPMSNDKDKTEKSAASLENVSSQRRREGSNSIPQRKLQETPSTPGRPSFSFTNINNLSRKTFPSKWDDAEKWLKSSSCGSSPAHNNMKVPSETSNMRKQFDNSKEQMEGFSKKSRNIRERVSKVVPSFHGSAALDHQNAVRAFNGVSCTTDIVLKDEFTDNTEFTFSHFTNSEPTKEGDLFRSQGSEVMKDASTEAAHHKDAAIETTTNSRSHTPCNSSSPARHNKSEQCHFDKLILEQRHNKTSAQLALANQNNTVCTLLDIIQPEQSQFDKSKPGTECDSIISNWGSREEQEEEISRGLRHNDHGNQKKVLDHRAAHWEEDEGAKCCLSYQREEAKIQAWVNLQSAKAEAQSRKLEVKIEKMRSKLEKKLMKKMVAVHRKADEWRAAARLQHLEQIQKATEQTQKMMINNSSPRFSRHNSRGCFPCNNNHR